MALTYKWFRCIDCGYSGEITTEEIAAHRSKCARGTTEPIAEQARAAEQGQCVCGHPHSADGTCTVCHSCIFTPTQRTSCPGSCITRPAHSQACLDKRLSIAREGYVSLENVEAAILDQGNTEGGWPAFAKAVIARLAKPAERVTVEKFDTPTTLPAIRVLLDGLPQRAFEIDERIHAERYAAGLREELKAGKQ